MTAAASDLLARAGFTADDADALRAPAGSLVELNPVGAHFYEVRITVGGANSVVTVVVPRIAVKVTRESTLLSIDR